MELKNKRVLVVGLGKSGIAAAHFLPHFGLLLHYLRDEFSVL